ncbi:MAG: hypothetical protein ACRD50_10215 [Candidatus Acidiferrales bacterium]
MPSQSLARSILDELDDAVSKADRRRVLAALDTALDRFKTRARLHRSEAASRLASIASDLLPTAAGMARKGRPRLLATLSRIIQPAPAVVVNNEQAPTNIVMVHHVPSPRFPGKRIHIRTAATDVTTNEARAEGVPHEVQLHAQHHERAAKNGRPKMLPATTEARMHEPTTPPEKNFVYQKPPKPQTIHRRGAKARRARSRGV